MRRIRDHGENETESNIRKAFCLFSEEKHSRKNVQRYEAELDTHVSEVLRDIQDETFRPSGYKAKTIHDKKVRVLGKVPIYDHHVEAAAILPYEKSIYDYISWRAPAVRPGLGTHAMFRFLRNAIYRHPGLAMGYCLAEDIHHYFPLMDHSILKEKVSNMFKEGKLRRLIFKVIDSYPQGIPLGIKLAQLLGMIYLADFDREAVRLFRIADDPEKMAYWRSRYITAKILTACTPDDRNLLDQGSQAIGRRFDELVGRGLPHYYRFVDNIINLHEDKAFLLMVRDLEIMHLTRDYHCLMNTDYNVRPVWMGERLIGYGFFPCKTAVSKTNKKNLARKVRKLQRLGFNEEQIRVRLSSMFAYAKHANSINLFYKLGMEKTLGKIIKKRRVKPPFPGMQPEQKYVFSELVKQEGERCVGWDKKIYLLECKVTDSKYKEDVLVNVSDSQGEQQQVVKKVTGKALAFRFKKILQTFVTTGTNGEEVETYTFEKVKDKEGHPTEVDAEYYSWSGSKIMIDQAINDFTIEDLPSPTYVTQFEGKQGKSYTKFT
ncbi:MAG: hypothetical protein II886_13155 [Prevotella sp.]|nr:hypothetical protein [Prevotella sp.]